MLADEAFRGGGVGRGQGLGACLAYGFGSAVVNVEGGVHPDPGMAVLKKNGKPKKKALPSTVARSGKKARRTFAKAHDAAAKQYGGGERAMRTAWAALEQTHELVGKRWRKKPAGGGIDSSATKKHLYDVARDLQIEGRSTMSKSQLIDAITAENERRSAEGGS